MMVQLIKATPHPQGSGLVFLDFDGVLNSHDFWLRCEAEGTLHKYSNETGKWDHRDNLDPVAVGRLNTLLAETNARVVVSSTWRANRTIEELQDILDSVGFKGEVIGKTPRHLSGYGVSVKGRGYEIQWWLDHYAPCSPFVIIDDDGDMAHLMSRWVWTPNPIGLQDHHVIIAKAVLLHGCSSRTTRMAAGRKILADKDSTTEDRRPIWRETKMEQRKLALILSGEPVPYKMECPKCGVVHIDRGEWATRLHKTHLCEDCGNLWRPHTLPTVGVLVDPWRDLDDSIE